MKSNPTRATDDPYQGLSSWSADRMTAKAPARKWDTATLREQMLQHLANDADAYPCELALGFPHVLARIVDLWGSKNMDAYFQRLLVADRQNRQGFPALVAKEIFRLSVIHGDLGTVQEVAGGWSGDWSRL